MNNFKNIRSSLVTRFSCRNGKNVTGKCNWSRIVLLQVTVNPQAPVFLTTRIQSLVSSQWKLSRRLTGASPAVQTQITQVHLYFSPKQENIVSGLRKDQISQKTKVILKVSTPSPNLKVCWLIDSPSSTNQEQNAGESSQCHYCIPR